MCGIFGQLTKNPKDIDLDKIIILGIMNEERGTTSCGLSTNDDIQIGTGLKSKFRNFSAGLRDFEQKTNYIIGHTRQASVGAANADNAHPFGFGNNPKTEGFAMIGAHNGTLYNYEDIALEFDVDKRVEQVNEYNVTTYRQKIDSEILLESIYKSENFKVLSMYHGGAALAFVNTITGDVYLYSGESNKGTIYHPAMALERPLHVWIKNENNMFFSSEADPLVAIAGIDELDNIFQIETNTVYKITNGDFKNAVKTVINRNNCSQVKHLTKDDIVKSRELRSYTTHRQPVNNRHNNNVVNTTTNTTTSIAPNKDITYDKLIYSHGCNALVGGYIESKHSGGGYESTGNSTSNRDSCGVRRDLVGMINFRFCDVSSEYPDQETWCNGVFVKIEGYGLYKIGDNNLEALDFFNKYRTGILNLVTDEIVYYHSKLNPSALCRDIFKKGLTFGEQALVYIYKGYPLRTPLDFSHITMNPSVIEVSEGIIDNIKMSHASEYPVLAGTRYYYDGSYKHGMVKDKLFSVDYNFVNGTLLDSEYKTFTDVMYVLTARRVGEKYYNNIQEEEKKSLLESERASRVISISNESKILSECNKITAEICGMTNRSLVIPENKSNRAEAKLMKLLYDKSLEYYYSLPNNVDFYCELHSEIVVNDVDEATFKKFVMYFENITKTQEGTANGRNLHNILVLLKGYL